MWKRAEGVEYAGAVRPERTVDVAESAFALPALVSGASGGASRDAAYGVNVAVSGEAATPRWLPGGVPEPSHCLHFLHHSLQSPQSCSLTQIAGKIASVGPVQLACGGWTVATATSAVTSPNSGAATRNARSVVGASACSLP